MLQGNLAKKSMNGIFREFLGVSNINLLINVTISIGFLVVLCCYNLEG